MEALEELSSPTKESPEKEAYPLAGNELLLVSNREPYQHYWEDDEIAVGRPSGGLTNGLDGAMQNVGGTWIAWGDGDADAAVVDDDNRVTVPPDTDDQYTLQRVWLSQEEVQNYYLGFSNRVLWPICHSTLSHVECDSLYWEQYRDVNQRFADVVADRVQDDSVVFLQDYHFGLAPEMIRSKVADNTVIAQFWHIPWPGPDIFRACPHGEEVLRGLLGNDLLGFHVERYCKNFLRCVDEMLSDVAVDSDVGMVVYPDGNLRVASFPLGVDADRIQDRASDDDALDRWSEFAEDHDLDFDQRVTLGVDRLDYSKGIPERLRALERLWEARPEHRESMTYVQIGSESRTSIPAYKELQRRVESEVDRINERFETDDWRPIVYTTDRVPYDALYSLYRYADVAIVSPIRDGMNLVAQEYVASQVDGDGVLVLSEQAGFRKLVGNEAVTVTPQDTDGFARALHEALTMPEDERRRKMRSIRMLVHRNDLDAWTESILGDIAKLRHQKVEA